MTQNIELDLSGNHWKMQRIRPGQGVIEGFHELPSEYQGSYFNWNQGQVPGDVYTDLQRAGEIDDPYFGRNFGRAKWVQEQEYWYMSKFNATEDMRGKNVELIFEGVDFSCEVWINGQYLGRHEGMFSDFKFDITRALRFEQWYEGCNIIMIKLDPPPRNYKKSAWGKFCFAGDYMPDVVPFGIWRPVKVRATGAVRVERTRIESKIDGDNATVTAELELNNLSVNPKDVTVKAALKGENFDSETIEVEATGKIFPGSNKLTVTIPVENAQLWWPWDMGDQNLYEVDFTIEDENGAQDTRHEVFGIREITMTMNPGFTPEEVENPWTFVINGKETFLRSACWGGQPSMLYGRNSDKKYDDRLNMVKEANINNLRIFGWHPPEVDYFYEQCDRLGITVWTNFTYATQAFEATPEFLAGALSEAKSIVEQRRNHPSAIFWMGGEEVFFSDAHVEGDNKLIMEELGKAVNEVTNVPYGIASPMSGEFGQKLGYKPKESTHANEHYYAAAEHTLMEEYYTSLDYCVIPELTAASVPNLESLKKFIPENELWPAGPSWGYHWADLDILRILNIEVFGDVRDGSLEEFIEATQTAQGMIFQFALEHFRRRKPHVSAVALCHFMTHMPDIKWGIIDYYGEKKLAFDYVARAYQPLVPSLEYTKRRWNAGKEFNAEIYILNDFYKEFNDVKLVWKIKNPAGEVSQEGSVDVNIEENSSKSVQEITWTVEGEDKQMFVVEMELIDADGNVLSSNYHSLLVGDQESAKAFCVQQHKEMTDKANSYGKSYYRYHPELWEIE